MEDPTQAHALSDCCQARASTRGSVAGGTHAWQSRVGPITRALVWLITASFIRRNALAPAE